MYRSFAGRGRGGRDARALSGPPAHLGPPQLDWSGEQLVAFAAASVRIEAELEAWTMRYAQADTPRTRSALLAANETAIRAVVEDVGLNLLQFDEIRRAAQGDPRLDARIAALVRRHWDRPEVGAPARR